MKSSLFFKRLWSIMGSEKLKRVTNTQSFEKWAAQELRKGNREDKQPLVPWYQRVWSRGPSKIHSSLPSYLCVCVCLCICMCVCLYVCDYVCTCAYVKGDSLVSLIRHHQPCFWVLETKDYLHGHYQHTIMKEKILAKGSCYLRTHEKSWVGWLYSQAPMDSPVSSPKHWHTDLGPVFTEAPRVWTQPPPFYFPMPSFLFCLNLPFSILFLSCSLSSFFPLSLFHSYINLHFVCVCYSFVCLFVFADLGLKLRGFNVQALYLWVIS